MKQNNISSRLISTLLVIVLTALIMISDENIVYADMPYDTYSYNYWGEDVLQPHAYLYSDSITSNEMGTTLSYPKDLFLYNEHLYIADTDNSRVLKISLTGQLILSITYGKDKEDLLNKPQGVFVTDEGHI